jgi:hypothetical protein
LRERAATQALVQPIDVDQARFAAQFSYGTAAIAAALPEALQLTFSTPIMP